MAHKIKKTKSEQKSPRRGSSIDKSPNRKVKPNNNDTHSDDGQTGTLACFPLSSKGVPRPIIHDEIFPSTIRAVNAFHSEVENLLPDHEGEYVVYRGRERLGIAPTMRILMDQYDPTGELDVELVYFHIIHDEPDYYD